MARLFREEKPMSDRLRDRLLLEIRSNRVHGVNRVTRCGRMTPAFVAWIFGVVSPGFGEALQRT